MLFYSLLLTTLFLLEVTTTTSPSTPQSDQGSKPWRDDYRCGPGFPSADGTQAECNPAGNSPCCSPADWCGISAQHCDCQNCIDYRKKGRMNATVTVATTSTAEGMRTGHTTSPISGKNGFCEEEVLRTEAGQLLFPQSEGQSFSYSEERCPSSSIDGKPFAARFCRVSVDGNASWDPPVLLTCDVSLRNLSKATVTDETALAVATELQVITTQAETLSSDDVTTVSVLIQEIVNTRATEQIGESILTTVDNLMNVAPAALTENQQKTRGPSSVVEALETFADTVLLTRERYTSMRPGVALQAADISPAELDKGPGFAFVLSGNSSESLREGSLSSFTIEERGDFLKTADITITLPANISSVLPINHTADVRLSHILYNDSSLFVYNPDRLFVYKQRGLFAKPSRRVVGSRIIGSRLAGSPVNNLSEPVIITFTPLEDLSPDEEVGGVRCVFWDFEAEGGQGAWSSAGCRYRGEHNGRYTCACNHLTNFAAFFDAHGLGFGEHETPLEIVTYVGCSVSITALVLTLLSFIITMKHDGSAVKAHTKNQRLVLINLCVALLAVCIIFVVGINQTASAIGCTVVAALLHYFLLASMIWMAVEAVNVYLAAVLVFNHYMSENFIFKAAAMAWGSPLIAVVATAGPSSLYKYRMADYCWLARTPLTYGFLLPVGLILLFNMVLFSVIMYNLIKGEAEQKKLRGAMTNKADHQWVTRQLRRTFSLMALFGLTWVFGFMVINGARTVFAYLFCIFNTLQGLFIFVFHCVMRESMKKRLMKIIYKENKKNWSVGPEIQSIELPYPERPENRVETQMPELVK